MYFGFEFVCVPVIDIVFFTICVVIVFWLLVDLLEVVFARTNTEVCYPCAPSSRIYGSRPEMAVRARNFYVQFTSTVDIGPNVDVKHFQE